MRKDSDDKIHFKVVFVGPSLSGKTTCLKWLYDKVDGLEKSGWTSIDDPSGRTLYFDYSPMQATSRLIFDVYTVAGQRRHRHQRKIVLRAVDGLIFVVDSRANMLQDNLESVAELRALLGDKIGSDIPLVIALNKRDLPDILSEGELMDKLGFDGMPVYETIATTGEGVKKAFQTLVREILLRKIYEI